MYIRHLALDRAQQKAMHFLSHNTYSLLDIVIRNTPPKIVSSVAFCINRAENYNNIVTKESLKNLFIQTKKSQEKSIWTYPLMRICILIRYLVSLATFSRQKR
jgi:hypothetical protein